MNKKRTCEVHMPASYVNYNLFPQTTTLQIGLNVLLGIIRTLVVIVELSDFGRF